MTITAHELADLTYKVTDDNDPNDRAKWVSYVKHARTDLLVETTSLLTSDEKNRAANIKALREAIISEIERKNTEHLVDTMHRLDKSADRLGRYSLFLTIVGVVLAALQVLQAFGILAKPPTCM